MNRLHLQAVAFRQANAHVMRRKTMRVLSSRSQLAREDKERLIAMIRLLETRLDEEREAANRWANACEMLDSKINKLRKRLGKWTYISQSVQPNHIYEFLEDIGINPCDLPNSLSDILRIRDVLKAVQL